MNNKIKPLEVIKKIYEGHIQFDDKPFVNKECDNLYIEIERIPLLNLEICLITS